MNARITFVGLILVGFSTAIAVASEAARPPLVYELTIDGQTIEVKDSVTVEVAVEGKKVQATVRIKPIQRYATSAIEFDYDRSLSLRDDFDVQDRTVTLMHGSTTSIVIADLGTANADGPKGLLAHLTEQMEKRIKRGTYNDLKKSLDEPIELKRAKGYTTGLTYKDEDGDEQICRIFALESKGRQISVIIQYDAPEREAAESLAKPTLDSIVGREVAPAEKKAEP